MLILWLYPSGLLASNDCAQPAHGRPGHRVVYLPAGCVAPFSGQLVEPERAIALGQRAERAEKMLELTLTATRAHWKAQTALQSTIGQIERRACRDRERALEADIERARGSWYEAPVVVAAVTVVAVVLTFAGGAALITAVQKK